MSFNWYRISAQHGVLAVSPSTHKSEFKDLIDDVKVFAATNPIHHLLGVDSGLTLGPIGHMMIPELSDDRVIGVLDRRRQAFELSEALTFKVQTGAGLHQMIIQGPLLITNSGFSFSGSQRKYETPSVSPETLSAIFSPLSRLVVGEQVSDFVPESR